MSDWVTWLILDWGIVIKLLAYDMRTWPGDEKPPPWARVSVGVVGAGFIFWAVVRLSA